MGGRLDGRVAVLIGGATGIGKGIAARLVAEGATLILADRNELLGQQTAQTLGLPSTQFRKVDVAEETDIDTLIDYTFHSFGALHVLVQNAGIYPVSLIGDTTSAQWDRILAVNLRSAFLSTRACSPVMKQQGWGRIVFTSSITGPRVVSHGLSAYASSKAGLNGFIRAAALELAGSGITVNGVEPGNILTEGLEAGRSPYYIENMKRSIPIGRLGTPQEIAGAVAFLASDDAAYVTGTTIVVDGGQTLPENKDFNDPSTWN